MGSYNLQLSITDTSATAILAVLIAYLSVYLHIALINDIRIVSIPVTVIIICLSIMLGAVQVVVHPASCACHKAQEEYEEYEEEEETDEVQDTEEDIPDTVEEDIPDDNSVSTKVTESRSIDELRAWAAKINEMNLKRLSEYHDETPILNPEEVFEPRTTPSVKPAESTS